MKFFIQNSYNSQVINLCVLKIILLPATPSNIVEATADPKNRYVAVFALLLNKKYNVLLVTNTINPQKKYYPNTATSLLKVSFLYL